MKRVVRAAGLVAAIVVTAVLATTVLPPIVWPDAQAPSSLSRFVPSARHTLWAEATDGLRLPLHLTFIEARCAADGAVALVFEEHRPPYTEARYAYAARGGMPTATDDSWGGGLGVVGPVAADPEFIHLMGRDPAPCR